jgi:hypothetical protein
MSNGSTVNSRKIVSDRVFCVAMSRCDRFVMIGLGHRVGICKVEDRSMNYNSLTLPQGNQLDSQRVNFSVDGNQAISATRNVDGSTYIYLRDLLTGNEKSINIKIKTVSYC